MEFETRKRKCVTEITCLAYVYEKKNICCMDASAERLGKFIFYGCLSKCTSFWGGRGKTRVRLTFETIRVTVALFVYFDV